MLTTFCTLSEKADGSEWTSTYEEESQPSHDAPDLGRNRNSTRIPGHCVENLGHDMSIAKLTGVEAKGKRLPLLRSGYAS